MKRQGLIKRILSVSLALCLFSTTSFSLVPVTAKEKTYQTMTPVEKQNYLEQKLKETQSKLDALGTKKSDTKEYLNVLDEKITYLNDQLDIIKTKVTNSENKIVTLKKQYSQNEQEIQSLNTQIVQMEQQVQELTAEFSQNFDKYCLRLRAMYISGDTNVLSVLMTSTDLGELLTRYEMVTRVAKQDSALLKSIQTEGEKVRETKASLGKKKTDLSTKQQTLVTTEKELGDTITSLESDKKDMQSKQEILSAQQQDANTLLKKITDETKEYTEYRDTTKDDLDAIDNEIAEAAAKYEQKTTTTTTKKPTTTNNNTSNSTSNTQGTTTTTTTESSSSVLSLTFPIPSQTKITTAFHGYAGHSGCDFACASGSKVVAAESGTVIISRDLTNSDGTYRSYGRYIVIAHDKLDKYGNKVYTLYAHNSKRVVTEGQYVKKGQLIAYSGSTGNSTGPHCHFEVRTPTSSYDDCVNPANYLP